ncbi:GTPase RsgA [Pseudobythopirellula maris]|uniref:GTPase RsgA n=1 Tax=Pseudobythopirellula maris TaxID=2527991 RepID=A0A5C5ZS43_9BACT|nr:AAA family ATPase [Pseudobythopirellula maris]TWT89868.1 GTPase RsgA [Pseudobythopirellula maris]
MYEDYWQLDSKPFEADPGPAGYYPCESHEGAALKLRYAIDQGRGAAALAGPSGVGKTLLLRRLASELDPATTPVVRLAFPRLSDRELLALLADRLEAPADPEGRVSADATLGRLERLVERNAESGVRPVVVLDEAQLLEDAGLLETVRLLIDLFDGGQAPWTLLLVGQMGLISTLARTPGLDERLAVKALVRTLTPEETSGYIGRRLEAAGATREVFSAEAIERISQVTGGVPRRINRLGDLALVVGFADGSPRIEAHHIDAVNNELVTASLE